MSIAHFHRHFRQSVRHGLMLSTLALFPLSMHLSGAEITVMITGTLSGGSDRFPLLDVGRDLNGIPFTLFYRFDDSKGMPTPPDNCPGKSSGITGGFATSPGKAVLTIGSKSFTFGERADSHSSAWRSVPSNCSESQIAINVREGKGNCSVAGWTSVNVRINGKCDHPLSRNADWRTPISVMQVEDSSGAVLISRVNDWSHEARSSFDIKTLTITSSESTGRK